MPRRRTTRSTSAKVESSSEEEVVDLSQETSDGGSDDDDRQDSESRTESPPPLPRRRQTRASTRAAALKGPKKAPSLEDSESEDPPLNEEDESSANEYKDAAAAGDDEDDNIEVNDQGIVVMKDSDEEEKPPRTRMARRNTRANAVFKSPAPKRPPAPRRLRKKPRYTQLSLYDANKKAAARVSNAADEKSDSGDGDDDSKAKTPVIRKRKPPRRRKAKVSSSDEEFQADSSDISVAFNADDSDDDSIVREIKQKSNSERPDSPIGVNIDDEKLGDAEESSDDDVDVRSKRSSRSLDERRRRMDDSSRADSPIGVNVDNENLADAEDSADDEAPMTQNSQSSNRDMDAINPKVHRDGAIVDSSSDSESSSTRARPMRTAPRWPVCFSTEDAVTMAKLPRRHVCYISPDGKSRACFCLSTLHKIAKTSALTHTRQGLDGVKQTFLQPPHFRSPMSDDLLDQIASRFGRDVLDLDNEYYSRPESNQEPGDGFDPGEVQEQELAAAATTTRNEWKNLFSRYLDKLMGSQDFYTCPVCYLEINRRIVQKSSRKWNRLSVQRGDCSGSSSDSDNSSSGSKKSSRASELEKELDENALAKLTNYEYDPMSTLADLDEDFNVAATFCFAKVSALKNHLRQDHNVDTRKVQGNDFYMRYRIRAPDGLLQRYLINNYGGDSGNMRRYWNEGHNQSFVCLQSSVEAAAFYRATIASPPDTDTEEGAEKLAEAQNFLTAGDNFFESFRTRAHRSWTTLASPFFKENQNDMRDFLAADDDIEDDTPHFLLNRVAEKDESDEENEFVNIIQRRYAEKPSIFEDADNSSNSESSAKTGGASVVGSDEEGHLSDINGYYSEVSSDDEEKDDWIKNIRRKKRGAKQAPSEQKPKPVGKSLKRHKKSLEKKTAAAAAASAAPVKRRIVVRDDDDDE